MSVIYLKSRGRRPVWIGPISYSGDVMGAVPVAWCIGCGTELYIPGACVCPGCERKEIVNGKSDEVSLQTLQAGACALEL